MSNLGFLIVLFIIGLVIGIVALSIALVCITHFYVKREEKFKDDSWSV